MHWVALQHLPKPLMVLVLMLEHHSPTHFEVSPCNSTPRSSGLSGNRKDVYPSEHSIVCRVPPFHALVCYSIHIYNGHVLQATAADA